MINIMKYIRVFVIGILFCSNVAVVAMENPVFAAPKGFNIPSHAPRISFPFPRISGEKVVEKIMVLLPDLSMNRISSSLSEGVTNNPKFCALVVLCGLTAVASRCLSCENIEKIKKLCMRPVCYCKNIFLQSLPSRVQAVIAASGLFESAMDYVPVVSGKYVGLALACYGGCAVVGWPSVGYMTSGASLVYGWSDRIEEKMDKNQAETSKNFSQAAQLAEANKKELQQNVRDVGDQVQQVEHRITTETKAIRVEAVANKKEMLSKMQDISAQLKQARGDLKKLNLSTDKKVDGVDAKVDGVDAKVGSVLVKIGSLSDQINGLCKQWEHRKGEFGQLTGQIENLKKEQAKTEELVHERLTTFCNDIRKEIGEVRASQDQLANRVEQSAQENKRDFAAIGQQVTAQTEAISSQGDVLTVVQSQVKSTDEKVDGLSKLLQSLEAKLKAQKVAHDEQIRLLQENHKALESGQRQILGGQSRFNKQIDHISGQFDNALEGVHTNLKKMKRKAKTNTQSIVEMGNKIVSAGIETGEKIDQMEQVVLAAIHNSQNGQHVARINSVSINDDNVMSVPYVPSSEEHPFVKKQPIKIPTIPTPAGRGGSGLLAITHWGKR